MLFAIVVPSPHFPLCSHFPHPLTMCLSTHSLYSQQRCLYFSFSIFPDCNSCSFLRHTTSEARTETCIQRRRKTSTYTSVCVGGGGGATELSDCLSIRTTYVRIQTHAPACTAKCMYVQYVHAQTWCQDRISLAPSPAPTFVLLHVAQQ